MPGLCKVGDRAQAEDDTHDCPRCPHRVIGPAVTGSPTVMINGKPALRQGDTGVHGTCCGSNTWTAIGGSASVFIDGKPAVRVGDPTRHCGAIGRLVEGSADVIVGD